MDRIAGKPAELIFQLGRIQVFYYPEYMDKVQGLAPKNVYYQDTVSKHTFGPFNDTYMAMHHYTKLVEEQRREEGKKNAEVVYVDFNRKKRIVFDVP